MCTSIDKHRLHSVLSVNSRGEIRSIVFGDELDNSVHALQKVNKLSIALITNLNHRWIHVLQWTEHLNQHLKIGIIVLLFLLRLVLHR